MGLSLYWAHYPPFQIDANFGLTAAVHEMLAFSKPGFIKLLPALPDQWLQGQAVGLLCRGMVNLDISWDLSQGEINAKLTSSIDQLISLTCPYKINQATVDNISAGFSENTLELNLAKNKETTVSLSGQMS